MGGTNGALLGLNSKALAAGLSEKGLGLGLSSAAGSGTVDSALDSAGSGFAAAAPGSSAAAVDSYIADTSWDPTQLRQLLRAPRATVRGAR